MKEIKFKVKNKNCITPCEFHGKKQMMVGSIACQVCLHNKATSIDNRTVSCDADWPEGEI